MGVTTLRTNTRNQQGQRWGQGAHAGNLGRIGRTHHQPELAVAVPRTRRQLGDMFEQLGLALHVGQDSALEIIAPGVGRAAQQERTLAGIAQVGFDRIKTHVRRQGDRVSTVAHKRFSRILLSGVADVAALGVQDHRHARSCLADVGDQALELVLRAVGGEIGNLGLEGQHLVGGGVDDGSAKVKDALRVAAPMQGEFGGIRVQTHAQERLVALLRIAQLLGKCGTVRAHRGILGRGFSAGGRGPRAHGRGRSLLPRRCAHRPPGN